MIYGLSIFIRFIFVLHVIKTHRDTKWIYIIVIIPVAGSLAYLFLEVLPNLGKSRATQKAGNAVFDILDPKRNVRYRREDLEVSNNIDNIINLAKECNRSGMYDDAIGLFCKARVGIYKDDPVVMLGLAESYFSKNEFQLAKDILEEIIEKNPSFKSQDGHLLYAMTLEGLEQFEQAFEEYSILVKYYTGPEAKYRHALLLKKCQREDGLM